jgi:hypothetical protein
MLGYAALLVHTYAGCQQHVRHVVGVTAAFRAGFNLVHTDAQCKDTSVGGRSAGARLGCNFPWMLILCACPVARGCLCACVPVCPWVPVCLCACVPVCLCAWVPVCLGAWVPGCLGAWVPGCLVPVYLCTCVPVCL